MWYNNKGERETEGFSPKSVSRDIKTEKEGILWRML